MSDLFWYTSDEGSKVSPSAVWGPSQGGGVAGSLDVMLPVDDGVELEGDADLDAHLRADEYVPDHP